MNASQNTSAPGTCLAVCAACGKRVLVPMAAGLHPVLIHEDGCPREVWPILDATKYDDGSQATVTNWPNGTGGLVNEHGAMTAKAWSVVDGARDR